MTIAIRLSPRASKDEVGGAMALGGETVLAAKVRALPDKGAANAALIALIATWLRVPKADVALVSGGKSRLKRVAVRGDSGVLVSRIERRLASP